MRGVTTARLRRLKRDTEERSETGWSAIRPVLVGCLLAADVFVVVALAIVRPRGWVPPSIAFGSILVGLVIFQSWAIRHRNDDEAIRHCNDDD